VEERRVKRFPSKNLEERFLNSETEEVSELSPYLRRLGSSGT
jgi:hypothetical protein